MRRARTRLARFAPLVALALACVAVPSAAHPGAHAPVLARAGVLELAQAQSGTEPAREPAAAEPEIPQPSGYVNDLAGVIDEPTRAKLEAFLDQLQRKTGAEFAVLTVRTTAPLDPSEYKVQVFERWGIGKQGEDNGLLMLVALEEHQVRFETGYGLEGTLPDGFQSRIFRRDMREPFRRGDYAGGITAGVLRCAAKIAAEKGVKLEWDGRELRYDSGSRSGRVGRLAALAVFGLLFILMAGFGAPASRRRRRGGWWIGPGGYGGGWGGGFGGGGGGGSFGGFGGGMSGGGGGGGSW